MIVESSGSVSIRTESSAAATMIVSATGTAYGKKGKIRSIIRAFRKAKVYFVEKVKYIVKVFWSAPMATKSGKPTSIDPPDTVRSFP